MMQRHQHNGTRVSGGRRSVLFDGQLTSRGTDREKKKNVPVRRIPGIAEKIVWISCRRFTGI